MSECEDCKVFSDEITDLKDEIENLEKKIDEVHEEIFEIRQGIEKLTPDLDLHETIWALEQL